MVSTNTVWGVFVPENPIVYTFWHVIVTHNFSTIYPRVSMVSVTVFHGSKTCGDK